MKKFYIYFFAGFILISVLLYLSIWFFFGGVAVILLLTSYHFYRAGLNLWMRVLKTWNTR